MSGTGNAQPPASHHSHSSNSNSNSNNGSVGMTSGSTSSSAFPIPLLPSIASVSSPAISAVTSTATPPSSYSTTSASASASASASSAMTSSSSSSSSSIVSSASSSTSTTAAAAIPLSALSSTSAPASAPPSSSSSSASTAATGFIPIHHPSYPLDPASHSVSHSHTHSHHPSANYASPGTGTGTGPAAAHLKTTPSLTSISSASALASTLPNTPLGLPSASGTIPPVSSTGSLMSSYASLPPPSTASFATTMGSSSPSVSSNLGSGSGSGGGGAGPNQLNAATASYILSQAQLPSQEIVRRLILADPKKISMPNSPLKPGLTEQQQYQAASAALAPSVVCTVNGPLNSFSTSPDGTQVAVVGRDVLKILSIHPDRFEEVNNLRSGTRINLNYSSIDVCWHPLESCKNIFATAATNGAVVVWDITHAVSRSSKVITEHTRTVNRVTFHPSDPNMLLSGSQDGTVKVWDLRNTTKSTMTFDGRAESVRDVQFNPHDYNLFATASETGLVQLWDIRKSDTCERRISSHHGPAFSVDWHPEDRFVLATGGRDKMIKVWELSGKPQAFASIQTIASVARVNWRPGFRWQISSSALLVDFNVYLWDLHRPYLPVASFPGHKDVTTRVAWRSSSSFLSSSKDSSIIMHSFRDAVFPADLANPVALSWSVRGELSFVGVRERELVPPGAAIQPAGPNAAALAPQHVLTASQAAVRDSLLQHGPISPFAAQLFSTSGGEYSPFVCRPRNRRGRATVQDPLIRISSAGELSILDVMSGILPPSPSPLSPSSSLSPSFSASNISLVKPERGGTVSASSMPPVEYKFPEYVNAITDSGISSPSKKSFGESASGTSSPPYQSTTSPLSRAGGLQGGSDGVGMSLGSLVLGFDEKIFRYFATNYKLHGDSIRRLCEHNAKVALDCDQIQTAQSWLVLKLLFDSEPSLPPQPAISDAPAHPQDPQSALYAAADAADDTLARENAILGDPDRGVFLQTVSSDQMLLNEMIGINDNWELPNEVIERISPISSRPSSPASKHSASRPMSPLSSASAPNNPSAAMKVYQSDGPTPDMTSANPGAQPASASKTYMLGGWDFSQIVVRLLRYYSERGDVQTSVSMLYVLQSKIGDIIEPRTQEQWIVAYVELLHRYELYRISGDIIRSSTNTNVQGLSQDTTTVHTSCSNCKKPLFKSGWACDRCMKVTNSCSICHQTVRGLYVWCQGCGHGGHLNHLKEWFSKHTTCPAGCFHHCEYV